MSKNKKAQLSIYPSKLVQSLKATAQEANVESLILIGVSLIIILATTLSVFG